ncbi:MAG: hypothetical protein ACQET7_01580 [Thermodesulfobacteriota bacterium]
MLVSTENRKLRDEILRFDRRIEQMHVDFLAYRAGEAQKMPEWEGLERELLGFSRRKINDLEIRNQLDRVMYKFQNRKKIWLRWAAEYQAGHLCSRW